MSIWRKFLIGFYYSLKHKKKMADKESRDLARRQQRTPNKSPRKKAAWSEENKENVAGGGESRKSLNFSPLKKVNTETREEQNAGFSHPVYKEISLKNGFINRQDLSTLKRMCKEENIDSCGKKDLVSKRLKQFYTAKLMKQAGLLDSPAFRGFDYLVVVDFEATCVERNSADYPHEIIEFPAVLVDVQSCNIVDTWRRYVRPVINPKLSEFCISLTGINQEVVDASDNFVSVLESFQQWLTDRKLGVEHTFSIVTDGPFDIGRFLFLNCEQCSIPVPHWATRWINLRKAFSNFYRSHGQNQKTRSPGLQDMLTKLDLSFEGTPHSGIDDARNIARVAVRLLRDGAVVRVNERLDRSGQNTSDGLNRERRLQHVVAMQRREAEDWLKTCRNNLRKSPTTTTPEHSEQDRD